MFEQTFVQTGKTKTTILRAIKGGKISAIRHEVTNGWMIEPAELHRLYPQRSASETRSDAEYNDASHEKTVEIELLREMLEERDRRVADKDAVIDELRRQLAAADEERRTTLRQLTALLTDQRAKSPDVIAMPSPASSAEAEDHPDGQSPPHASPPPNEASWWRKMMGGR